MNDRRTGEIDAGLLTEIRRDMLRFANMQLRDDQLAEDVVQEAMMAALEGERSSLPLSSVRIGAQ